MEGGIKQIWILRRNWGRRLYEDRTAFRQQCSRRYKILKSSEREHLAFPLLCVIKEVNISVGGPSTEVPFIRDPPTAAVDDDCLKIYDDDDDDDGDGDDDDDNGGSKH